MTSDEEEQQSCLASLFPHHTSTSSPRSDTSLLLTRACPHSVLFLVVTLFRRILHHAIRAIISTRQV